MSSSSVTAPTSRPSASRIGVERMRNARRAPSTAHGSTAAALFGGHRPLRAQHVGHRLRDARVARDRSIGLPSVSARAPNSRSAAGLMRVTRPSLSVTITGS